MKRVRNRKKAFAELRASDKNQIVARLRAARLRKRAQNGRCEGRKPYGYREGEQPILERMRELRAEGLAYGVIAGRMNAEGVSTRTRGRWHSQMIWRILRRESV